MNISLNLNQEQLDALEARVDLYNTGSGNPPISQETFLSQVVLQPEIDRYVQTAFDSAVNALGESAKSLPYDQRIALIQSVRTQLA